MKTYTMPETPEQIEKNRKYVEEEIQRCLKIAKINNLKFVCVIYWAPLSNCLESRLGYFEDNFDAVCWKDKMSETYSKFNVPFEIYCG